MTGIHNNTALGRFEMEVGGKLALAYYRRAGDVVTFTHTEVPKELRGQGLGSQLARGVLDWARAENLTVVPRCSFIGDFIDRHPDYSSLLG